MHLQDRCVSDGWFAEFTVDQIGDGIDGCFQEVTTMTIYTWFLMFLVLNAQFDNAQLGCEIS